MKSPLAGLNRKDRRDAQAGNRPRRKKLYGQKHTKADRASLPGLLSRFNRLLANVE